MFILKEIDSYTSQLLFLAQNIFRVYLDDGI